MCVSLLSLCCLHWTGVKSLSLITSRPCDVHSCTLSFFLSPPSLRLFFFPRSSCLPNAQLKSKFSSHCRVHSVYSAKLPNAPSYTHMNPSSFFFPFSLPFFAICQSLPPLLFRNTSCSFSCLLFFRHTAHPSYLLFFRLFVQLWVSVREAQRVGMAAWHKHTRLPISPPGCPTGGLGNFYILYILPHLTPSAFPL